MNESKQNLISKIKAVFEEYRINVLNSISKYEDSVSKLNKDFMNNVGIIHQPDIDKIINNLEESIPEDNETIKKKYKNIIKKLKRFWYDNTKSSFFSCD